MHREQGLFSKSFLQSLPLLFSFFLLLAKCYSLPTYSFPSLIISKACLRYMPQSQLRLLVTVRTSDAHCVFFSTALISSRRLGPMTFFK